MTAHLHVLVDRACRGVASPTETEQLRAGIAQLQQRATSAERQYELAMEGWNREAAAQDQRTGRYRAAWQSARARAHHARCVLADYHVEADAREANPPRPHNSHTWQDQDTGERNVYCEDCFAYVDNIGDEDDAAEWAEQHQADATAEDAAQP